MSISDEFQEMFVKAWQSSGLPLPGAFTYKGKPVKFSLSKHQHLYTYFDGRLGVMHCYTPHPSTDGDYFVWDYVPKGTGARTGKAKMWAMKNVVRCAHRNVAKNRALARSNRKS